MDENNTKNETPNTSSSTDTEKELSASAFEMNPSSFGESPSTAANYYSSTGTSSGTGNTTAPYADPSAGSNSDFYTTSYAPAGESVSTGFAIASLVMGILSILGCCCYGVIGILFGILGIIFGCIQPKDEYGKKPGMAVAGIITSAIGLVMGIIVILCLVLFAGASTLKSL